MSLSLQARIETPQVMQANTTRSDAWGSPTRETNWFFIHRYAAVQKYFTAEKSKLCGAPHTLPYHVFR